MPEQQSESKSSVKVNLTAKGEAQVEVKVYEEPTDEFDVFNADAKVPLPVERLMATIHSLERQRIKVVGRDLPEVESRGDAPEGDSNPSPAPFEGS